MSGKHKHQQFLYFEIKYNFHRTTTLCSVEETTKNNTYFNIKKNIINFFLLVIFK